RLEVLVEGFGADEFLGAMKGLGVDVGSWLPAAGRTPDEYTDARAVLLEANSSGYAVGRPHAPVN
ncbi:MAG TPA: hypothetical protein VJT72_15605, partial [Pseudonocardiaceae bacterium]|nr:hypothetical protein [Pseudonocardiaceae bacterium]